MSGILPETASGGVITRSAGGIPANPNNVSNVYVPPEDFAASCALTALPDDCSARITAAQINAIVSELMCFAATLNPTGTWTCSSLCNLATNFEGWLAALSPVMSFNGRSGDVTLLIGDLLALDGAGSGLDADLLDGVNGAAYALLASPAFTGTPTAPTAAPGTNTTQIATMAAIQAMAADLTSMAFDTRAQAIAATIPATIRAVILTGYYAVGDMTPAVFVRTGSAPAHAGYFQSADGAYWVLVTSRRVDARWFGVKNDGSTNNLTSIQNAFNYLATGQTLVFVGHAIYFNGCVTVSGTNGIGVHFDNAQFLIGDTGTSGTVGGASGKIGFIFSGIAGLAMTGTVRCIGQGTAGTTSLAGIVFHGCSDSHCVASMLFDTMAAGRFLWSCGRSVFGDVIGNSIRGLQTFEAPPTNTAGSVEVVVGCQYIVSGSATGYDMGKPVRYMSVGTGASNNLRCTFGATVCVSANAGASWAGHALALRSAVNCTFGGVQAGPVGIAGVLMKQYTGDQALGFLVDGNYITSVTGVSDSTASSVEALVTVESADGSSMGTLYIGHVEGTCAGYAGILVSGGGLVIGTAKLCGATDRLVVAANLVSGHTQSLRVGHLTISDNSGAGSAVTVGKNTTLSIGTLYVPSGRSAVNGSANTWHLVRYDSTASVGGSFVGVAIDNIFYRKNGTADDYLYLAIDTTNGFNGWQIRHIDGIGNNPYPARFAADNYRVEHGRYICESLAPTSGTYNRGDVVWHDTPSASAAPGSVCVTAGTPGTWKSMAVLAS